MQPIHPSESSHPIYAQSTPQERQKIFELEFQIAVIGDFIAANQQNGSLQRQVSQIKNGIHSGQPLEQLASSMNHLIIQVNKIIIPGKAPFPDFVFSESSQVQAIRNFSLSLEKLVNALGEGGKIQWKQEEKFFQELSNLIYNSGQLTSEQAFNSLNRVIDEVNKNLNPQDRLPKIGG